MEQPGKPADPGDMDLYLSPYEVWNFGVGKDYAFPGMRKFSKYISALAEIAPPKKAEPAPPQEPEPDDERDDDERDESKPKPKLKVHLPTLWMKPNDVKFLPFVIEKPFEIKDPLALQALLRAGLKVLQGRGIRVTDIKESRFRVAFPIPDLAMREQDEPSDPRWKPDGGLRGRIGNKRITIMAVIDDGLPFAHRNFRDKSGARTRIEFCWLQSAAADDQTGVLFGREYTRERIEDLIAHYADDEDRLYDVAGATADAEEYGSPIERHATHGAHVMDLATGYAPDHGEDPAEEIRIIAVQLPTTIAQDTSGFGKDMYMLSAFHYIFHRAGMIADKEKGYGIEKPRLVINFSYGFSGGSHDGGTELEAAIHELIQKRREVAPTALVLAAGNFFLDRLHGVIREKDFVEDEATFHWRLQPNDRTPSYLELWFCKDFNPTGYSVELSDPFGRIVDVCDSLGGCSGSLTIGADSGTQKHGDPTKIRLLRDHKGQIIGQISSDHHRGNRWRVLVVMAPSEPENDCLPGIVAGKWTVTIRRGSGARLDAPIHCWIQRDADPGTFRSGSRQSYFDDPRNVGYDETGALREVDTDDAFVRRFGSLNGLATADTSMIVAGFRLGQGLGSSLEHALPALYSSAGIFKPEEECPSANPAEGGKEGQPSRRAFRKPQVACSSMSDRSKVLPGTIAAGVRSGARSFVQGTSAAAPFIARQLAKAFVTAEDAVVEGAAAENYRPLLSGWTGKQTDLTKARLGAVRVRPHRQPGLEP